MSRFSFLRSSRQEAASGKGGASFGADDGMAADLNSGSSGRRQRISDDPALPEKKRARRRLVGAVTLTLAAIIVLPLVLDPEPKPVSQDVAIDIASRNKPVQAPKERETAQQPAQTVSAPNTSAEPAAPAVATAAAGVAAIGTAAVATSKLTSASTPDKTKSSTKPLEADKTPLKHAETAKVAAKTADAGTPHGSKTVDSKASDAKTAESGQQGKLIIQVAALANQKKADELQAKLREAGIKSHTQKVTTRDGERIRVRIGPLANKKDADGMCAKLGRIRLQCTLLPV